MSLDDLPAGTTAFVDSTILHYALVQFEPSTGQCIRFFERVAKQEISACLHIPSLNDAVHKVMCSEVVVRFQRPRAGLVRWMKENPRLVRKLVLASDLLNVVCFAVANAGRRPRRPGRSTENSGLARLIGQRCANCGPDAAARDSSSGDQR